MDDVMLTGDLAADQSQFKTIFDRSSDIVFRELDSACPQNGVRMTVIPQCADGIACNRLYPSQKA